VNENIHTLNLYYSIYIKKVTIPGLFLVLCLCSYFTSLEVGIYIFYRYVSTNIASLKFDTSQALK